MRVTYQVSNREARWLAIGAQGLGTSRRSKSGRRPGTAHLRRLLDQVATIQLDAVNVVERTQFLVPFSRIGSFDPAGLRGLTGPGGPWFEYWGHAASLLPTELYPLFRWRMERWRNDLVDSPQVQERRRQWREAHAGYLAAVLDDVTERGPLTASQLTDPRRRTGDWWARRSDGRRALELLFGDGVLAAWRSPTFERVCDLTDRVIPPEVLNIPAPHPEEAQRELIAIAARCMGVATAIDLADYFWIRPGPARLRIAELIEAGRLVPVGVEGWNQPAFAVANARPRAPRREHASLLSPFDSLIWTRDRTKRLFDFHYRIEIYVPQHLRTHGYYVLPLLVGDELVARFDLKADRKARTLQVRGSYLEPGATLASVVDVAATELRGLSGWLGLERITVGDRGNLASALRKTVGGGGGGMRLAKAGPAQDQ
jgi:uncharacterized protein YcaQ